MSRFSDICRIIELKELNWLCKHMKNVRSSQPCISMNFVLNSVKQKFAHVSIVGWRNQGMVIWVIYQKRQSRWKNRFNSSFRRRSPDQSRLPAINTKFNLKSEMLFFAAAIAFLKRQLLPRKSALHWQTYQRDVIPDVSYPFKPFSILNFIIKQA